MKLKFYAHYKQATQGPCTQVGYAVFYRVVLSAHLLVFPIFYFDISRLEPDIASVASRDSNN
jgi:hypothetical protein